MTTRTASVEEILSNGKSSRGLGQSAVSDGSKPSPPMGLSHQKGSWENNTK